MSTLEDLLPEMAGVFAVQESALGNCIAVLTTQLQNLGLDCSRRQQRVASLEASQQNLMGTITDLQTTVVALTQQNETHAQQNDVLAQQNEVLVQQNEVLVQQNGVLVQHTEILVQRNEALVQQRATQLGEIAPQEQAPVVDLSSLKTSLVQEMEAHTDQVVMAQLTAINTKLTQQMDERLLETSNRAFRRAQQSEETFQSQLEMLEKKFGYLSKIKMEIKDLGKRMDKQDQTLDDMRTVLALLAKSVGSDEAYDDEDADVADTVISSTRKPSTTADVPTAVMPTVVTLEISIEEVANEEHLAHTSMAAEPLQPFEDKEPQIAAEPVVVEETPALQEDIPVVVEDEAVADVPPLVVEEFRTADLPVEVLQPSEEEDESSPDQFQPDKEVSITQQPEDTAASELPTHEPEVVAPAQQPESETPPPSDPEPQAPTEDVTQIVEVVQSSPVEEVLLQPMADPIDDPVPEAHQSTPTRPPGHTDSDNEHENSDTHHGSFELPLTTTPDEHRLSHPQLTAPSVSTVAYIRSRRQERTAKKLDSKRELTLELASGIARQQRVPLTLEEIKEYWLRIFNKIVQLKRLQSINGTSPERTLFRKQNISMGARVKRLEETTTDLEETIELLETNIHNAGQRLHVLNQAVAQSSSTLDKKTKKLDEGQRMQAQSIMGIEEKFEVIEADFRRMKNAARRDSTQNSVTATAFTQIAAQIQDVTTQLSSQSKLVETHDKLLEKLVRTDLPGLTANVQSTVLELRAEVDFKNRELGKEVLNSVERLRVTQVASSQKLEMQLVGYTDALYRDLLVLTSANLVAVELAAKQSSSKSNSSPSTKPNQKSPLEVSIGLLQSVIATFESECRKALAAIEPSAETSESGALVAVLFDKLKQFHYGLAKLKEQADKAVTISSSNDLNADSTSKGVEGHLILICTNQLRTLEEILVAQSHRPPAEADKDVNDGSDLIMAYVKDLVIQLRAVLFLLLLHTQLVEPPQQIRQVQMTQTSMDTKLSAHEFALNQYATVEAVVKLMNSRLDSFIDMSFSFAKDEDVKKSIQDMLDTGDELREQLSKQLDWTHEDAVKRDELIEREVSQLASRVQKKLDKDEMLWTQEVFERQLQNLAKGALGEEDLVDIQRALRAKMDKTQFHALLQQQHAKLQELGAGNGTLSLYGGGSGGNQPLVVTRCISCDGELPPSTSQMRAAVREEVQLEVAKALAAAKHHSPHSPAPSSSSAFNVSGHRSMDKHKKELLMAALKK